MSVQIVCTDSSTVAPMPDLDDVDDIFSARPLLLDSGENSSSSNVVSFDSPLSVSSDVVSVNSPSVSSDVQVSPPDVVSSTTDVVGDVVSSTPTGKC